VNAILGTVAVSLRLPGDESPSNLHEVTRGERENAMRGIASELPSEIEVT